MKNHLLLLVLFLCTVQWGLAISEIPFLGNDMVEHFSFITLLDADTIQAEDTPILISTEENTSAASSILVASNISITDIKLLDLDLTHTYVGDISATLESPEGTIIQLFNRPGVPAGEFGCEDENLFVSFDDAAINTAEDFENTCEDSPAIGGTFQPLESFSSFLGENAAGVWTLTVLDIVEDDGGSINDWKLAVCGDPLPDYSFIPSSISFISCVGDALTFSIQIGPDFDSSGVYLSGLGNPVGSTIAFSNNLVMPGQIVDFTISDVDNPMDFTLALTATDSTQTTTVPVSITYIDLASPSTLNSPTDLSVSVNVLPTLEWEATNNTDTYSLQLADNPSFTNLITTNNSTNTNHTLTDPLEYNTTYYWRVFSENSCSSVSSSTFSFSTEQDVAVDDSEIGNWQISPNPTRGKIDILFSDASNEELTIDVYDTKGIRLQQYFYKNAPNNISLNLDYDNGLYLIRLISEKGISTKRIFVLN